MRMMLVLAVLVGCSAPDVHVRFPAPDGAPTGSLVLMMSQAASDVAVAIEGVLVLDGAHTQRVVIDNVPVGHVGVVMTANGADRQFSVWVGGDHATTVPLGIPDQGVGFLKTLAGSLITIVVYTLLHH